MKKQLFNSVFFVLMLFLMPITSKAQSATIKGNFFPFLLYHAGYYKAQLGVEYLDSTNKGYFVHYVLEVTNYYSYKSTNKFKLGMNTPLGKRSYPFFINSALVYEKWDSRADFEVAGILTNRVGKQNYGLNIGCGKKLKISNRIAYEAVIGLYPYLSNSKHLIVYADGTRKFNHKELELKLFPYINCTFTYSFPFRKK